MRQDLIQHMNARALPVGGWLLAGALLLGATGAWAAQGVNGITAVSSKASKDYVRTQLPDGSYQAEPYGFGEGGRLDGTFRDPSVDKLTFLDVARVLAGPLAERGYVPARDLDSEQLLIMVYWGTTVVPASLETSTGNLARNGAILYLDNQQRDILNYKNAKILGYDGEKSIQTDFGNFTQTSGLHGLLQDELISELEDNRYFVVLMAYDFQTFRRQGKHVLLWQTRFSVNELHNRFDVALPGMARYASQFFGQDSRGLIRQEVPEGRVKVGEPTVIEAPNPDKK